MNKKKILYYVENLPQKNWIFNYSMSYKKNSSTNLNFYSFFYYPFFDEATSGKLSQKYKFLKNKEIYVKGPWSGSRDKYITITIGPSESMERFVNATKEFLKK